MAYTYVKTEWEARAPITKSRMMNIENGLAAIATVANTAESDNSTNTAAINGVKTLIGYTSTQPTYGSVKGEIDNLNEIIGNASNPAAGSIRAAIQNINDQVIGSLTNPAEGSVRYTINQLNSKIDDNIKQGADAWKIVNNTGASIDSNGVITKTLSQIFYSLTDAQNAWKAHNPDDVLEKDGRKVDTLARRIEHIYETIDGVEDTLSTDINARVTTEDFESTITTINDAISIGYYTINERLTALDGIESENDSLPERNIKDIQDELETARNSSVFKDANNQSITYDSLYLHLTDDETKIKDLQTEVNNAHRTNFDQDGHLIADTLDMRFDDIDGGNKPDRTLPNVITEIENAHRLGLLDTNHQPIQDTLGNRFSDIEDNYIPKTNIINNVTATVTGGVLDATQGKLLNDAINTVNTNLSGNISTLSGAVTSLQNALNDENNGLEARMATAEENISDLQGADVELDRRIDALEDVVQDAIPSTEDEQTGEITYGTLGERFGAVESRASQLENDISAIATELSMSRSDSNLSGDNTRIDNIQNEITVAHKQTGVQDEQPIYAYNNLNARFEDIENAIDHTHVGENDELPDGLTQRITTLEGNITGNNGISARLDAIDNTTNGAIKTLQDADAALGGRLSAIDGGTAIDTTNGTLASRVSTLEGKDTFVINKPQQGSNYSNNKPSTAIITAALNNNFKPDADYLIQNDDDKYYYWRYINNEWEMISGAGSSSGSGTGMNNAQVYDSIQSLNTYIQQNGYDEHKDYYVLDENKIYHHYRYLKTQDEDEQDIWTQIEIGQIIDPDILKTYNIAVQSIKENNETNSYLYLFDFDAGENNHPTDAVINQRIANNDYVNKVKLPSGGGGSGTLNLMQIRQITPIECVAAVNSDEPTLLRFFFTTGEVGGKAYYNLTIDGKTIYDTDQLITGGNPANAAWVWPTKEENGETIEMPLDEAEALGFFALDVSQYCTSLKDYTIRLDMRLMTNRDITANAEWTMRITNFKLISNSPDGLILSTEDTVSISYTPFGNIQKTLHIVIDDNKASEKTVSLGSTISGREREYNITQRLSHGIHKITMWMTANINGFSLTSNTITKEYIWYDPNISNAIILASPLRDKVTNVTAYSENVIPYSIYNTSTEPYIVEYYLNYNTENETLISTDQLTGNVNTSFTFIPTIATADPNYPDIFTIKVGNITLNTSFVISAITQDIAPIDGAVIDFDPALYSNNSINREPTWGEYNLTVSDNFNWSNSVDDNGGGYREDPDGKCFIIKAGSYVDINYPLFKPKTGTVFTNGAEIKIIFKTDAVRQADAVWLTSLGTLQNKTVGLQLNAHNGWLKTNKAVDYDATDTEEEYDEWVSGKTDYQLNDIVIYKKKITDSYIIYKYVKLCKNYTLLSPDTEDMSSYWELVDEIPEWSDAQQYNINDITINNNIVYICTKATESTIIAPASDSEHTYWIPVANWVEGQTYSQDNAVIYNDNVYKCIKDVVNQFIQTPKDLAGKNWLAMGMTQDKIIATNSYLYFPYSEADKIELDININQYSAEKKNNFIMSYEDGVPSKAYAYDAKTGGDNLQHTGTIHIGSPDCDVYIYKLRIYNKALEDEEILQNFIADGKTVKDKIDRYERNCIYCDDYNQFSLTDDGDAYLNPIKLAEKMPNVKVLMLDTPRFTTGKKDFVKGSSLRCLQIQKDENNNFIYPEEGNWFFQNGFHAGQGTTSDNYGQAGRNVDFLFECDGKHWPTKKKNIENTFDLKGEDKNYISSVLRGHTASKWNTATKTWEPTSVYNETTDQWEPSSNLTQTELVNWELQMPEYCEDWKGDTCKVALTPTSVPNNYFNLKVNIASSENVNNALFQKRYNDYVAYSSPATINQLALHSEAYAALGMDPSKITVKNGMEFVPAVLFIRENDPNTKNHTEFTDCEWHFYALGNIGDSKKSDYTRAYDPTDMNEYTVENSDNNTNNGQFQSGVYFKNKNHNIRYIETAYDSWSNKVAYKKGAYVIYNGQLYIRTGDDMALPTLQEEETLNLPWVAADWALQSITISYDSQNIDWQENKVYSLDTIVLRNNIFYRYNEETSSADSTWNASKWSIAEVSYMVDDLLYHNNQLYRYIGEDNAIKTNWISSDWATVETQLAGLNYLNPMEYIYPITPEEWNTKYSNKYLNNRHLTLVTEDFDGDHSFEFRYACKGDYRDGDLINDTNGDSTIVDPKDSTKFLTKDDVQFTLNQNVFYAFYEWVVTTSRNKYRDEAPLWFVPSAMEFFYAFTHYYTLMDNRAKNTFWHFAKTGTRHAVPLGKAVPELMHIYEIKDGNTYVQATGELDNSIQYYTQYAFDLWIYDTDTAAGIDNNGALIFPYGKEDEDYRVENDPDSGYAFNGAGSIFWRRLKDPADQGGFEDGIIDIMTTAKENCFSSQHLIDQFDEFQAYYPEEIWRLDIQRKYIRTFTGVTDKLSYDNAVAEGKHNTRFLTSMMQGRKKYQRRQWIRNQGVYFQSKYRLAENTTNRNEYSVTLGAEPESLDVPVDYTLKLTPYQDMYLNVVLGNGTPVPSKRAKAGQEYPIPIPTSGSVQETRVYINGGDYLSGIKNLAPMYPYSLMFSHIAHLKEFDMGTDIVGYVNTKLAEQGITALGDGGGPLLEKVNVKNCHSLATLPSLNKSNNLEVVEATGTAISGISLPEYTNIKTLHLPSTITELSIQHAHFLNDFYMLNNEGVEDYSNLYTLSINDSDYSSNVNWVNIAISMLNKQSLETIVELLKLNSATIPNIQTLTTLSNFKKTLDEDEDATGYINLEGTITITGTWSKIEAQKFTNNVGYYDNGIWTSSLTPEQIANNTNPIWPNITLIINPAREQQKYLVNYYESGYNGNSGYVEPVLITSTYINVNNGSFIVPDLYITNPNLSKPTREPTVDKIYTFGAYDEDSNYIEYSGWMVASNLDSQSAQSLMDFGYPANIPSEFSSAQESINLYTYYNHTDHQYTVQWKIENRVVKEITGQPHGGGYDLEAPTAAYMRKLNNPPVLATVTPNSDNVTCSYKIFDGWEKLPIDISPGPEEARTSIYIINAKWDTADNQVIYDSNNPNSIFYGVDESKTLTPKQLLILSRLLEKTQVMASNPILSTISVAYRLQYTMGYNGAISGTQQMNNKNITGTELIGSNPARVLSTTTNYLLPNGTILPFEQNKGFTIAIDYQFGSSSQSTYPEVLVGCYSRTNDAVTGFALYRGYDDQSHGNGTFICYGTSPNSNDASKRKAVGDATHRNIIVLRHPAGSSKLYVYSSLNSGVSSLNTDININENDRCITLGTQNLSDDAQICIGYLRADMKDSSNEELYNKYASERVSTRSAQGTVYWMKYWDADLGIGECKQLVSWPHEQMTAMIAAKTRVSNSYSDTSPKFYLTNLNLSNLILVNNNNFATSNPNTTDSIETGWDSSNTKAICDDRIFYGLPPILQATIGKPTIGYYKYRSQYRESGESISGKSSQLAFAPNSFVYVSSVSSLYASGDDSNNELTSYQDESLYELNGRTDENPERTITPYGWMNSGAFAFNAQTYVNNGETKWAKADIQSYWFNIRFKDYPILWTTLQKKPINIYQIDLRNLGSLTLYNCIGSDTIKTGDIVIYTNNNGSILEGVFMYLDQQTVIRYGIQGMARTGVYMTGTSTSPAGVWIKSVSYTTRSVPNNRGAYSTKINYLFVNQEGNYTMPVGDTSMPPTNLNINFAFTM